MKLPVRIVCALALCCMCGPALNAVAATVSSGDPWAAVMPRVIHIDDASDLALIKVTRPEHYRKIQKILADIQDQSEGKVGKWLQTTFDAREISYKPLLLVTAPPQRRLSFRLDDARYAGVIIMTADAPLMSQAR